MRNVSRRIHQLATCLREQARSHILTIGYNGIPALTRY